MLTLTHIADTHLGHRQYGVKQREDDMVSTLRSAIDEILTEHETDAPLTKHGAESRDVIEEWTEAYEQRQREPTRSESADFGEGDSTGVQSLD